MEGTGSWSCRHWNRPVATERGLIVWAIQNGVGMSSSASYLCYLRRLG